MREYKKILLARIYVMTFFGLAILVGYVLNMSGMLVRGDMNIFSEFHQGFQIGLTVLVEIIFIYLINQYIRALKRPEELKRLYYAENDERMGMIREKSGGYIMFICAIAILIAAIIAGYFNETVFWTLVGCSLFLFVTRKALLLYYSQKL